MQKKAERGQRKNDEKIVLKLATGHSAKEISELLGIPYPRVRERIKEIKSNVRLVGEKEAVLGYLHSTLQREMNKNSKEHEVFVHLESDYLPVNQVGPCPTCGSEDRKAVAGLPGVACLAMCRYGHVHMARWDHE